MDYEFRFFRGAEFEALHITALESDAEALERARAYLGASPHFPMLKSGAAFISCAGSETTAFPAKRCNSAVTNHWSFRLFP